MASIAIGLIAGYAVSIPLGLVNKRGALKFLSPLQTDRALRNLPFGTHSRFTHERGKPRGIDPLKIKGGILGDGFNSALAAVFNTFPNTTFSQNNGVIQLTGVGSRYVGYYVAAILALLSLFPIVGGVFRRFHNPFWAVPPSLCSAQSQWQAYGLSLL